MYYGYIDEPYDEKELADDDDEYWEIDLESDEFFNVWSWVVDTQEKLEPVYEGPW